MNRTMRLLLAVLLALPLTVWAYGHTPKDVEPSKGILPYHGPGAKRVPRADGSRQGVLASLKYEKLPNMSIGRTDHLTFPTSNGGFVVVGGSTTDNKLVTVADLWQNGKWKTLSLQSPHVNGFSAALGDGRIMVGGCSTGQQNVSTAKKTEIYNPDTQSFTAGPDMTIARGNSKAIMAGGKLFVSGNSDGGADNVMDYYNGSSFKGVGDMDPRYRPYLFHLPDGYVVSMSYFDTNEEPISLYTFDDGSKTLLADRYNLTTGEVKYMATPYNEGLIPTILPSDMESSDYHFTANGKSYYMILAGQIDSKYEDGFRYVLLLYSADENQTYIFSNLQIPSRHPETGASIEYRGGVIVNEAKREAYLIGFSGYYENETLHILSFNYVTEDWTLASASGFKHDMIETASWSLLSDGRLACTGGAVSIKNPSTDAYIFTPPVAGEGGDTPPPPTGSPKLVVWLKSGEKVVYDPAESPETTFSGTQLIIRTAKATVNYERKNVLRYTYESVYSGIELQPGERRVQIDREGYDITFRGLPSGTVGKIYTVNGMLIDQVKVIDGQPLSLSLQNRPSGVYIIKAGTETIKLLKQ